MQEEHVHDVAGSHDGRHDTEEAADNSRENEGDVVIGPSHLTGPDLAEKGSDEAPEDDGTAANDSGQRRDDKGASHPTGQCGGHRVEHVGLGDSIGRDLEDEGELVGVWRHLTSKSGEADGDEDEQLLSHGPVLCSNKWLAFVSCESSMAKSEVFIIPEDPRGGLMAAGSTPRHCWQPWAQSWQRHPRRLSLSALASHSQTTGQTL